MKVYLSPSAQVTNSYYGNLTNEHEQMEKVAVVIKRELEKRGVKVYIANLNTALKDRCSEANKNKYDAYVAIHSNAYNGSVEGTECFYNPNITGSLQLAKAVYNEVAKVTRTDKDRGLKSGLSLLEINSTMVPCCLTELEFHDKYETAIDLIKGTEKYGIAVAKGICNYLSVNWNIPTYVYRVQVGVYPKRSQADEVAKDLREKGYTYASVVPVAKN